MLSKAPIITTIPAVDINRAKKFYQQTLGLNIAREDPQGVSFNCGSGTQLFVYPRSTPTKSDQTAASWAVDNLDAEVRELRNKGIVFEHYDIPGLKTNAQGIAEMGQDKAAWFKDTEGNILSLTQMH